MSWEIADKEVARERLATCMSCDKLRPIILQCKECNCLMAAKVRLADAWCPIGQWGKSSSK